MEYRKSEDHVRSPRAGLSFIFLVPFLSICTSAAGGSRPAVSARPRLFFTAENMTQFRQRIARNEDVRRARVKMRERADRMLKDELVSREYSEGGTGQHGNYNRPSGQIARMGPTLGLAYRMTGDRRYAEKLRQALLHYGTFSRWAGDAGHDPPWHSELNTARFCFGYAVAYDCIYDFLSETDRRTIARSMVKLGIGPTLNDWVLGEKRIHALDSMGHNWWSVCVSMAGLAALSLLDDEPQAQPWVERVSDSFLEWFYYSGNILQNKSTNFDAEGAFYESVNYADYALSEYLLFRLAYSNTYPDSRPPEIGLLEKAGDFFIDTCYPTSASMLSANFGDSKLTTDGARTLWLLSANGYQADEYRWYIGRTNPGLDDPIALVCCRPEVTGSIPEDLPLSAIYSDIGWAVMRSSWADDATMLAVKSGFAWNHAHPDSGSFILFHAGKPLIIDSGNCSYSRREYTSYYRQSKAHNVILHDGGAQNPEDCGGGDRGVVTSGHVHNLLDLAGFRYVLADAAGPTSWRFSRNYRHFMWIDDAILIVDDVRAHEAGKLEWLLHYTESVDKRGRDLLISNGPAQVLVRPLFPENVTLAEKKGLRDRDPDTEVVYLALSPEKPAREMKFITAVLPMSESGDENLPRLERLTDRDAIGVRIHGGRTVTDVYLNLRADGRKMHRNSCNTIGGWETDAYLFGVTRPIDSDPSDADEVQRYFVACGSYLRRDGKVVLDSLSKVYTVFTSGGPRMDVALQGQPVIRASLRAGKKPRRVELNGQTTDAAYDESRKTLTLFLDSR